MAPAVAMRDRGRSHEPLPEDVMPTTRATNALQPGHASAADSRSPHPKEPAIRQHGLALSVLLHLLPGLLALAFYVLTVPVVTGWGYPPLFASVLSIPFIIVPFMLGWLALEARRMTGRWQPLAAVGYRNAVPWTRLLGWSAALVAWGMMVFGTAEALNAAAPLRAAFAALPDWFLDPASLEQLVAMGTPQLVLFMASMLVLVGVVAPAVEELYYRGNLMPGLGRFGAWAPVIGVALFTLYHFESPWEGPARFVVVLPMAYVVRALASVRLGVIVHVALNTLSAIALAVAVLAAR
jgi:uncharacterized protein